MSGAFLTLYLSHKHDFAQFCRQTCGCQLPILSTDRLHRYYFGILSVPFHRTQQRSMGIKLATLRLIFGALTDRVTPPLEY